jgi:putative spermidine/putrescine transport system ATP-binding protein/spermidine/putrescine transport system ATP-binding protein
LELAGLTKRFGTETVLDGVSLIVEDGEFVSLLGPSGSGKTTTLRLIAGFLPPDEGAIFLGGERVDSLPSYRRNVGVVFQNYALFPHMTVAENVAFGLRQRRIAKDAIAMRVREALEMVQLEDLGNRRPHQLSGGQQQRVALARALVIRPRILLLDESLSALDKRLRVDMQIELRRIQQEVGITTVFVTHDQEEAMTMSDRIAVMSAGRIAQYGPPHEIYSHPKTTFVARALGEVNVLSGRVRQLGGNSYGLLVDDLMIPFESVEPLIESQIYSIGARPGSIRISTAGTASRGLCARVEYVTFVGSLSRLGVTVGTSQRVIIEAPGLVEGIRPGDDVALDWAPGAWLLLRDD